jgi:hypothetical protein
MRNSNHIASTINAKARLWAGSAWITIILYQLVRGFLVRLDVTGIWRFPQVYRTASANSNGSISLCRKTVGGGYPIVSHAANLRMVRCGSERPLTAYPAGNRLSKTNRCMDVKHPGGRLIHETDTQRIADKTLSAGHLKGRRVSGSGVLA